MALTSNDSARNSSIFATLFARVRAVVPRRMLPTRRRLTRARVDEISRRIANDPEVDRAVRELIARRRELARKPSDKTRVHDIPER